MTTKTVDLGKEIAENFLEHYGIRGMKWGVRKDRTANDVTFKTKPGRKVKTKGGQFHSPSEDAVSAARSRQIARRSTTDALSTKDLQALVNRMQLEDNYSRIIKSDARLSVGKLMAKNLAKEFDADLIAETAGSVAGALGRTLSPASSSKIKLGAIVIRTALGVKGGGKKKK